MTKQLGFMAKVRKTAESSLGITINSNTAKFLKEGEIYQFSVDIENVKE